MAMDLDAKVRRFIELAGGGRGGHLDHQKKTVISDLLLLPPINDSNDEKLVTYVMEYPEILPVKVGYQLIYDYFYEKMIDNGQSNFWIAALILATKYLNQENVQHADVIFLDKKYVMNLQSDINNHTEVFSYFVTKADFVLTPKDYEFLACSLAARGELPKLLALSRKINLSRFRSLMATALAYGRSEIISFLIDGLKFQTSDYGRILDLEFFTDHPKYLHYCSDVIETMCCKPDVDIVGSVKNYEQAIKLIYECSGGNITVHTLDVWSALATKRKLPFSEIYRTLKPFMKVEIPLEHDFGQFNELVFGAQWSKRSFLIEYCKRLEQENYELMEQIEMIKQRFGAT